MSVVAVFDVVASVVDGCCVVITEIGTVYDKKRLIELLRVTR